MDLHLFLQRMVLLLQLVEERRLSLPSLDFGTQILSLRFQLAHSVFTLLKQGLQVLDLLVFVPNLTQHLLQVILQKDARKHFIFSSAAAVSRCGGLRVETEAQV